MQIAVHLLVANISTAALSFMQQGSEYGEGCALADVAEAEEHLAKVIAEHRAWREKQEKRLALAGDLAQRLLREIDAAAQGGER